MCAAGRVSAQATGKGAVAHRSHHELILGALHLVRPVRPPALLNALVSGPRQLKSDMHALASVGDAAIRLQRDACERGHAKDAQRRVWRGAGQIFRSRGDASQRLKLAMRKRIRRKAPI